MSNPRVPVANALYVDDPMCSPKNAAAYLGISPRTLRKLNLPRDPMPGTGQLWGYRRSTLNAHLLELAKKRVIRHFASVPVEGVTSPAGT